MVIGFFEKFSVRCDSDEGFEKCYGIIRGLPSCFVGNYECNKRCCGGQNLVFMSKDEKMGALDPDLSQQVHQGIVLLTPFGRSHPQPYKY